MRKLSLICAGLLLTGIFLPHAAQAGQSDLLLRITSPAPATTPAGEAGCKADLSPGAQDAVFLQTGTGCGSCSDSFCQGRTIGQACSKGLFYTCQNAYGLECPAQPTLWKCTCWPPNTPFP